MLKLKYWAKARRASRLFPGYPIYGSPIRKSPQDLTASDLATTYSYFMGCKNDRVAALMKFTASWDAPIRSVYSLDDATRCLSKFMFTYGGYVTGDRIPRAQDIFYGANVLGPTDEALLLAAETSLIFDLGIWFGEALIAAAPNLKWRLSEEIGVKGDLIYNDNGEESCDPAEADLPDFGENFGVVMLNRAGVWASPLEWMFNEQRGMRLARIGKAHLLGETHCEDMILGSIHSNFDWLLGKQSRRLG